MFEVNASLSFLSCNYMLIKIQIKCSVSYPGLGSIGSRLNKIFFLPGKCPLVLPPDKFDTAREPSDVSATVQELH